MFNKLLQENTPEETGDTLWIQCLQEIMRVNGSAKIELKEVDRLVILASRRIRSDFHATIQEIASDSINGFTDGLPF